MSQHIVSVAVRIWAYALVRVTANDREEAIQIAQEEVANREEALKFSLSDEIKIDENTEYTYECPSEDFFGGEPDNILDI